jgi:hypothetical protein
MLNTAMKKTEAILDSLRGFSLTLEEAVAAAFASELEEMRGDNPSEIGQKYVFFRARVLQALDDGRKLGRVAVSVSPVMANSCHQALYQVR